MSNFLDQNNPKSSSNLAQEWEWDFEGIKKSRTHVLSGAKIFGFASSF